LAKPRRLCARAIAGAPETAAFHFNLGNLLTDQSRFDDAAASYPRSLAPAAAIPRGYSNLGVFCERATISPVRPRPFEAAVKQNPDYAEARYNLANAYRDHGRLTQAEVECAVRCSCAPATPNLQ